MRILILTATCVVPACIIWYRAVGFGETWTASPRGQAAEVDIATLRGSNGLPTSARSLEESGNGSIITDILNALEVLQQHYFEPWQGTWPDAIDWTAAVVGTQVSSALNAITRHPTYQPTDSPFGTVSENTISGYFTHITSFYFGENAFSLRSQAYDDMQWVVLGWIEGIKTIRLHSDLHFTDDQGRNSSWHGRDYIAAFAHRARVFWDLATEGWDNTLCGGGMLWSPHGVPYKNAITNELYIAASVSMYLHFPGDGNGFPFDASQARLSSSNEHYYAKEHDPKYLKAATVAYSWLKASNMTNEQGLYTDGFHIAGWRGGDNGSNGTSNCDVRDDKVYTYNQGVILTGQRGLWEATGEQYYLEEGHALVRNVIAATGFPIADDDQRHRWAGLGRNGVLEESCDATSSCTQNGQTFKGVFFHHLAAFCEPLPIGRDGPVFHRADKVLAGLHRQSCIEYGAWIARNAEAAVGTRDFKGRFGSWWTIGLDDYYDDRELPEVEDIGTDYRNKGLPFNDLWRLPYDNSTLAGTQTSHRTDNIASSDPNDHGRGRTVETQTGGLAVLSALYRIVEISDTSF